MKLKLLTLLATITATTALMADLSSFEGFSVKPVTDSNTCKYIGFGVGNPELDLTLGARKQWSYSGIDAGVSGETSTPIRRSFQEKTQVQGYANYLFFPSGKKNASFYLGAGASGGVKIDGPISQDQVVGAANLLIGRSFANKQFVQAKVGFPMEYNRDTTLYIRPVSGAKPVATISYGIGF